MLITSGSGRVNLLYTPIGSFEFVTLNHWFFLIHISVILFYNTEVNCSLSQAAFPWHYMSIYNLFTNRLGLLYLVSFALDWPLVCHLGWPALLEFFMVLFTQHCHFFYLVRLL